MDIEGLRPAESAAGVRPLSRISVLLIQLVFSAWCAAQAIQLFTLPLVDALGAYESVSGSAAVRLAVLFVLALAALYVLQRRSSLMPGTICLLSLQLFIAAAVLRSPFASLSGGLLILQTALFVLVRRRPNPRSKIPDLVSALFWLIGGAKLVFNLIAGHSIPEDTERFSEFLVPNTHVPVGGTGLMMLLLLMLAIAVWLLLFGIWRYRPSVKRLKIQQSSEHRARIVIITAVLIMWLLLTYIMATRILAMHSSIFDMGIFTQMFEGMRRTGLPVTTLERNEPLSHFAVHFSPILYLLLPLYALIPGAMTLQIVQLLIVASSVFPLRRILKHLQLPPSLSLLLTGLLLVSPQFVGSNLYDFHENCFLPPLLLWLLYALLQQRRGAILLFTVLTLAVKEDAAVYVISIGLWVLSRKGTRRDPVTLLILLLLPLLWFAGAVRIIQASGGTPMLSRFSNLNAFKDRGSLGIIPTLLIHPAPVLANLFSPGKLFYLFSALACAGFLPILQKRAGHYFLLLPMLVINLLSNWPYQYAFRFQYGYGSAVLIIFAVMLFICDLFEEQAESTRPGSRTRIKQHLNGWLSLAFSFSLLFTSYYLLLPKAHPPRIVSADIAQATRMRRVLDDIPRDLLVHASPHLALDLADVPELYDIRVNHEEADPDADLLVIDLSRDTDDLAAIIAEYRALDYEEHPLSYEDLLILVRPEQ